MTADTTSPAVLDWNARAAALYPDRWARMEALTGKRRANARRTLRLQAENHDALAALPTHASCGTCEHFIKSPVGRACDLDSDFHGYTLTSAEKRCARWQERTAR